LPSLWARPQGKTSEIDCARRQYQGQDQSTVQHGENSAETRPGCYNPNLLNIVADSLPAGKEKPRGGHPAGQSFRLNDSRYWELALVSATRQSRRMGPEKGCLMKSLLKEKARRNPAAPTQERPCGQPAFSLWSRTSGRVNSAMARAPQKPTRQAASRTVAAEKSPAEITAGQRSIIQGGKHTRSSCFPQLE
jgi:hypothetical protein